MSIEHEPDSLTPAERAVVALVVEGLTSKAIGARLGISPRTVEFHRANILQKLRARNVADLMRVVLARPQAYFQSPYEA